MCVYARKSFGPNPAGLEVYSIFSDILFCWCRGTAGGLGGGGGGVSGFEVPVACNCNANSAKEIKVNW